MNEMNETPGARMMQYFRDALHQDVLIFIDNVFRFLQAGSEVSTLLGRMPSCTEMGSIQERIVATKLGSITSIQAIFVPADDLTDPAPAIIFGHLDAIIPCCGSISEEHLLIATSVKQILQRYKELQDVIAILGLEELCNQDRVIVNFVAEIFTRIQGSYVSLDETIMGLVKLSMAH